jgi:abhydrolase domain-containing protein 14
MGVPLGRLGILTLLLLVLALADPCTDNYHSEGAIAHVDTGGGGVPVVLLHGARYDHRAWCDAGTVAALSSAGFRVLAVDLPGRRGLSKGELPDTHHWLPAFIRSKGLGKVAVLAASRAGKVVVPWLLSSPSDLLAVVGVAPVGLKDLAETGQVVPVPLLIVYGEHDPALAKTRHWAEAASGRPVVVLPHAHHACYLDAKEPFNAVVVDFLRNHTAAPSTASVTAA